MKSTSFSANIPSLRLKWQVLGFLLGACLVLLLATDTGLMVRRQIADVNPLRQNRFYYPTSELTLTLWKYANEHPNDIGVQSAYVWTSLQAEHGPANCDRLLPLLNSSGAEYYYAVVLRCLSSRLNVEVSRTQGMMLDGKHFSPPNVSFLVDEAHKALAVADDALKLFPRNTYFAVQKMYLMDLEYQLLVKGGKSVPDRNTYYLGVAKVLDRALRGGTSKTAPYWNDWVVVERDLYLKAIARAYGYVPSAVKITLLEQYNALTTIPMGLFEHLSRLMDAYQISGDTGSRLALHVDLSALGILMASQNTVSSFHRLGEKLLESVSENLPGNGSAALSSNTEANHHMVHLGVEHQIREMRALGYTTEAEWFSNIMQNHFASARESMEFPIHWGLMMWMGNHLLLTLAMVFAVLGGITSFALYQFRFRLESSRGITPQAARGATAGTLLAMLCAYYNTLIFSFPMLQSLPHASYKTLFLVIGLLLSLYWGVTQGSRTAKGAILSYLVTFGLVSLLGHLSTNFLFACLGLIAPTANDTIMQSVNVMQYVPWMMGGLAALPLICAGMMMMAGIATGKPIIESIGKGICRSTLPSIAFVLLLFVGNSLYLSRWESAGNLYAQVLSRSSNTLQLQPMIENLQQSPLDYLPSSLLRRSEAPPPKPIVIKD